MANTFKKVIDAQVWRQVNPSPNAHTAAASMASDLRSTLLRNPFTYNLLSATILNRFNIITFDSSAALMFPDAVLATPENVATAIQRAAGGIRGSTNSLAALRPTCRDAICRSLLCRHCMLHW